MGIAGCLFEWHWWHSFGVLFLTCGVLNIIMGLFHTEWISMDRGHAGTWVFMNGVCIAAAAAILGA